MKCYLFSLVWYLAASAAVFAQTTQTNVNSFQLTFSPPDGTIFVEGSTNTFTNTISNWFFVTPPTETETNSITNYYWTNVTVVGQYTYKTNNTTVTFTDSGNAGIFVGSTVFPDNIGTAFNLKLTVTTIGGDTQHTNDAGAIEVAMVTNKTDRNFKVVPRPPNDRYTNAIKIATSGGTIRATNNYASMEPNEVIVPGAGGSVWWLWSSPVTTNVLIDTAGSSFNTVIGVFTNAPGSNAIATAGQVLNATNDVQNNLRAHANLNAQAGVTYRIAIA